MQQIVTPEFWLAVGQIIIIDLLPGGDNAVVIALACRKLPARQCTLGITAGAILLRVALIVFAMALLLWIGIKLLRPEMVATDPVLKDGMATRSPYQQYLASALGALSVLLAGKWLAARATPDVIGVREDLYDPEALELHRLNAQRPVSGEVPRFVPGESLKEYHREGSEAALALLAAAGLKAQELGWDRVVMGTRGLGGSVAQAMVAQCGVPVLLMK